MNLWGKVCHKLNTDSIIDRKKYSYCFNLHKIYQDAGVCWENKREKEGGIVRKRKEGRKERKGRKKEIKKGENESKEGMKEGRERRREGGREEGRKKKKHIGFETLKMMAANR